MGVVAAVDSGAVDGHVKTPLLPGRDLDGAANRVLIMHIGHHQASASPDVVDLSDRLSRVAWVRPATVTVAPSAANAIAAARPIPVPPPVIRALCP